MMERNMEMVFYLGQTEEYIQEHFMLINDMVLAHFKRRMSQNFK